MPPGVLHDHDDVGYREFDSSGTVCSDYLKKNHDSLVAVCVVNSLHETKIRRY